MNDIKLSAEERIERGWFTQAEEEAIFRAFHDDCQPLEWGAWLLRFADPAYNLAHLDDAPQEAGIYALCGPQGQVLYIGQSTCLFDRLWAHRIRGRVKFQHFSYRLVPGHALDAVESAHIEALNPPQNRQLRGSWWGWHQEMVRAIRRGWEDA